MVFSFLFCIFAAKIVLNNQNMKQFNLGEYLKNPLRKVVTRDGRNVRILCTDREGSVYPIVALIKDDNREMEILVTYTKDGRPVEYNEAYYTLFFAPEKHEGWINVFDSRDGSKYLGDSRVFKTKEDAEEAGKNWSHYITSVKIEWEE